MANKVTIELYVDDKGSVHVKKFAGETEKSFKKMEQQAEASTTRMGSALQKLKSHWMAVTAAVAGVILVAKKFVTAASDLQEVNSKFNVVFKDQIDLAEKWAKQLVDSYAMSQREAKEYLSSIQDLLVPMGMAADSAGKMSIEVVKLAADLGSFNNLPTAQVMADIQSGLVGNYETMKKYGVVLNETVVQEKALAMGLAATKDELTAGQKAQAGYTLMVEGSKAAVGDMARTSGDYANQMKQVKARMEELAATIATPLLPALASLAQELNIIAEYWTKAFKRPEPVDLPQEMLKEYRDELREYQEDLLHYSKILEHPGMSAWIPGYLDKVRAWREEVIKNIAQTEAKIAFLTQPRDEEGGAAPGGPAPVPPPPFLKDYYKDQLEEWKQVTADFYAMKAAQEKADLEQHKATLDEWGQVTKDFAEAEQAQWEQETENYLALEEIKAQAHQEELARYEEVMKANEDYMKQYAANEKAKAALAYQTTMSMVSWYAAAFKELAKGSELAFTAQKMLSIMETLMKTHEFAVKAAAWAATWGGLPAAIAAKSIAWGLGMAHVMAIQAMEPAALYHTGGIVGRGSRPSRLVSPDVFAGAQRAHTGLGPDEKPVIVRKDEGIFTPAQMAALGAGLEGRIDNHVHVYLDGKEQTKAQVKVLEKDGMLLGRFQKALS